MRWPRGRAGTQKTIGVGSEREAREGATNANRLLAALDNPRVPFTIPENVEDIPVWLVSGGLKGFRKDQQSTQAITTIDQLVEEYLTLRRAKVASQEMTGAVIRCEKYFIGLFLKHCKLMKRSLMVDVATESTLTEQKAAFKGNRTTLLHMTRSVKRLLEWAYRERKLDTLPRNLEDYCNVKRAKVKKVYFTDDEIKILFSTASRRVKAYMALALLGSWTAIDIATFTHDMINWDTGIIVRERHKTEIMQSVKLPPAVLALLKKEATHPRKHPDNLVLVSEKGNILTCDNEKTFFHTDLIRDSFCRLRKKCGITKSFKIFRKTGSDAILEHFQDKPWLADLQLAHSIRGTRRYYTETYFDELYKAQEWLAEHYGLSTLSS